MKRKWQYTIAAVVGLTGALFGGIYGSLMAAFAGDSWWTSKFALSSFQYAVATGGVCLGAVPGLIWLACLRQRWVLPILWAAGCALLLPVFQRLPMANATMGLLYAAVVALAFGLGSAHWVYLRKVSKG